MKKKILAAGIICFFILIMVTAWTFMYLSDAFKPEPSVTIHADNIYDETLHVITDIDYEPFSYADEHGRYMGMDIELIAEIANRIHVNLDLTLTDWPSVNEKFFSGEADAILNMETDSVASDSRMTATLPTIEKQYVVYGKEEVHSVPELYGKRIASLHRLPELGLDDSITYINSYAKIFEELKRGTYDFAICPIQVGNMFLSKLSMKDFKPSYAVDHVYGAIALKAGSDSLRTRMNEAIRDMQKEGMIDELERKWITHRYQSMTVKSMIESHPMVLTAFFFIAMFITFLLICVMLLYRNMRDTDIHSRELQAAKDKAEENSRAKSVFLSNMSHEIRTPINAILGMNEMIIREASDSEPSRESFRQIASYAGNVERAGKNLLSIINDILDYTKIERGKMEVVAVHYKLSSLLNDSVNMIIFRAREKGLLFSVDVDENLPDGLEGDEVRIRQILTNILSNAVKFTGEGSVTLSVKGEKISDDSINIMFSVRDTGKGIKPEDLNKLFAEFERVNLSRDRTIEGTGLGLAITKNLLSIMNGTIIAESEYGRGSTFTVKIPQKVRSWENIGNFRDKFERSMQEKTLYHETFHAPDARILIVDDTQMNLIVAAGLLEKTKLKIDTASGGYEALKLTKNVRYDLIFMDKMMPEMDGTETMKNIRTQSEGMNHDTPVICLTADAVSGAREEYLRQGFNDYLSKPVEGSALEASLMKYLPAEKIIMSHEESYDVHEETATKLQELYSAIDGLNYSDAIKFCSNEDILEKTLRTFFQSIDANASDIEKFLQSNDIRNYTIKVHALKSSARLIGASELSAEAKFLEECGDESSDESIKQIKERTPGLLEEYRAYKVKLTNFFGGDDKDLPEITPEDLNEIYEAIKEFAYSFDIDSIDKIIEEARKFKIPYEEKSRFEAIETAVRNMDWDELNKALAQ